MAKRPPKLQKAFLDKTVDAAPASGNGSLPPQPPKTVEASSFSSWSRNISPAELNNSAVAKTVARMLLAQTDKLLRDLERCRMFEDKYHEKHAQAEVLKERLRGIRAAVSVRVFLSSAGFGIAGFAPFFWSANNGLFWVCLILGAVIAIISNSDVIVGQVLSMFTSSDDQPDKYEDQ